MNKNKDILINLIIEDLRIYRIRKGFMELGFDAPDMYTDLPEILIQLMEVPPEKEELILKFYLKKQRNLSTKKLSKREYLKSAAKKIHNDLMRLSENSLTN